MSLSWQDESLRDLVVKLLENPKLTTRVTIKSPFYNRKDPSRDFLLENPCTRIRFESELAILHLGISFNKTFKEKTKLKDKQAIQIHQQDN